MAAVPIAYLGYHYALRRLPTLFSGPLEPDAATELCQLLGLAGDPRCRGDAAHAFEFLPELRARYPQGTPGDTVAAELAPKVM